jgi:hypothetical protein
MAFACLRLKVPAAFLKNSAVSDANSEISMDAQSILFYSFYNEKIIGSVLDLTII